MSGLRGGVMVMPPKPRPGIIGLSPRIQALRSIPAQNVPPAPVSTPTRRASSLSSSSAAAARARAAAPSSAFLASGRLMVMTWTWPRRSAVTGSAIGLLLFSGRHPDDDLAGRDPVGHATQRGASVFQFVHLGHRGPHALGDQLGQRFPGAGGLLRQPLGPRPQLESADGDVLEQDDVKRDAGDVSPGVAHGHEPPAPAD